MAKNTIPKLEDTIIDDLKDLLVDFGLPFAILVMLFVLMMTGIDGEVKTLMAGVIGWIVKSGVSHTKR